MKICFPVLENRGLESVPHAHFGTAPFFLVCDMESEETSLIENRGDHQSHGGCAPVNTLRDAGVEAVVVGGIGPRAVIRFQEEGIRVFRAVEGTVKEHIELLRNDQVPAWDTDDNCQDGEFGGV